MPPNPGTFQQYKTETVEERRLEGWQLVDGVLFLEPEEELKEDDERGCRHTFRHTTWASRTQMCRVLEVGWGLRNTREPFTNDDDCDLVRLRLTLKEYGRPLDNFNSSEQLLLAFRDAVAGHRILRRAGALHRDISFNNILLGNHGTPRDGEARTPEVEKILDRKPWLEFLHGVASVLRPSEIVGLRVGLGMALAPPTPDSSLNSTANESSILRPLFAEIHGKPSNDDAPYPQLQDAAHLEPEEIEHDICVNSVKAPILKYSHTRVPSEAACESANSEHADTQEAKGHADSGRFPTPEEDSGSEGEQSVNAPLSPSPQPIRSPEIDERPKTLAQILQEIECFHELEEEQAEHIKTLARKVFAAAWKSRLLSATEIRECSIEGVTDLLGGAVGQRIDRDAKYLRRKGSCQSGRHHGVLILRFHTCRFHDRRFL
ncbi:hypothetical protein NLJ89_g2814 [Agrocybe chaxingu]|uniref:Fungal-type protein kinase domain-containing protein n=1 Tax=Agrocybe chaxingu TaxID=84603 RepID=A0A9W8KAP6_9AGAR|nr:hypothetical protein NLJ89_g2814 [Agrocybe chaxingu]